MSTTMRKKASAAILVAILGLTAVPALAGERAPRALSGGISFDLGALFERVGEWLAVVVKPAADESDDADSSSTPIAPPTEKMIPQQDPLG